MNTRPNQYAQEAAALNRPAVRQPALRPNSIRRTSSMQSLWTPGEESRFTVVGRARDLSVNDGGDPSVLGEDFIDVVLGVDGRIASVDGSRHSETLAQFSGMRPGGELRKAMARAMGEEGQNGTRLYRLLDDLAGALFMSAAAWYAWEGGIAGFAARANVPSQTVRSVRSVCLSYVEGSPMMSAEGQGIDDNADHPMGPPPLAANDASGFHALIESDRPNQWRLRRTDLWHEDGCLMVDAWFQDSASIHDDAAHRILFHEYGIVARFDAATLDLLAIEVTPHVLPYVTCHAAPATAKALIGRNAKDFPGSVLALLKGEAGCTHLNDMLRSLQDVAGLADMAIPDGTPIAKPASGSSAD